MIGFSTMTDRTRRWYAVQTQPHKEAFAAENLERQRFPAFLPRIRKTVRHARRQRTVLAPLFPRYLFVALDLSRDRWRSVNGTFGVNALVTDGTRPLPVPQGLVEHLMSAADHFGALDLSDSLVPGQKVRFLNGPLSDMMGELLALDDAGRARILVEFLGSQRKVIAPASALASVSDWDGRGPGA